MAAPAAGVSPSPSNPRLELTSPKAGDGQPQAMPATAASKLGFDGGEPRHGMDGVGRVVDQDLDGGEPRHGMDGGGDPTMLTNAAGGKRPQTPQSKNGSLVKKRKTDDEISHVLVKKPPTIIKASQSRNQGLRSPMQATSSPGVNFLLKSAAVKKEAMVRASMAGSPKMPQPPSSQLGSPSLHDLSPDTRATNSQGDMWTSNQKLGYFCLTCNI